MPKIQSISEYIKIITEYLKCVFTGSVRCLSISDVVYRKDKSNDSLLKRITKQMINTFVIPISAPELSLYIPHLILLKL